MHFLIETAIDLLPRLNGHGYHAMKVAAPIEARTSAFAQPPLSFVCLIP